MCKFYKKNEVWFAVLWIAVYCFVSVNIPGGSDSYWCILFLAVVALLLTIGARLGGLDVWRGLTCWPQNKKRFLYFIPLWVVTTSNLWSGIVPECTGLKLVCSIISMLFVGYVEEVLFRGYLFTAMVKSDGFVTAAVVSSVTFGIGHIINLFTGADTLAIIIQILFAIVWGFLFTIVYYKSKSLWPGIISHALVDVFSYFNGFTETMSWIVMGIVIVIAVGYILYLMKLPDEAGRLYIMRHGITDWNVKHKLQGQTDIPLNEEGRELARKAHDEYKDVHFDVCFCSPLLRARETAEILLEGRDVPLVFDDRLKEMSFGEYEGIENSFDIPDCPINLFFTDPAHYVAPGTAETMEHLFSRTGAFLAEKVNPLLAAGRDVVIVGHGAMNNSIICQVRKLPRAHFWDNGLKQCTLTELGVSI